MTAAEILLQGAGMAAVASPVGLLAILGGSALIGLPLSERVISRFTQAAVLVGLVSAVTATGLMLASGTRYVAIDLGNWVAIPQQDFHFRLKFVLDRLSIPFVTLAFLLCGVVGAFTTRYLHREPGYRRFFLLYALFLTGMVVSAVAGTIETLFFGWELVGLSSALLVAFFHERENPVRNGQRVWSIYRLSDAAFLLAALMMHHVAGAGDFSELVGQGPWPEGRAVISPHHGLLVGLLLLVAAAGKSALVPFSGWLPRAMEGPTPSSAVFYGALSVHLGAYLLLRVSPILDASWPLQVVVVAVGLLSAVFGTVMARVQSDIKSSLAYASLTQVGIIVVEIGLGFRYLALVHIIGHACLRTLLLALATIPPWLEIRRRRCTRVYALHMGLFVGLLVSGWALLQSVHVPGEFAVLPGALLTAAALLRSGIVPVHCWMSDLFEKATFGTAVLFVTPLTGAYAVMRLVLPIAPDQALRTIAAISLFTAIYAGAMALVQREARRFFCYLFLSHSSLVLVGLELATTVGFAGALCVWLSVGLSLTGFGITLRCIEARIGRISFADFHGLYQQMPTLAGFFVLTGLSSIGFPATVGFVGMELLIEGAVAVDPVIGTAAVLAAALNGIAVVMAYFRIFTGRPTATTVPMHIRLSERLAVLVLSLLIIGGGLLPQPGVASRYHAAAALTHMRQRAFPRSLPNDLTFPLTENRP